jgi:hypothetical protein
MEKKERMKGSVEGRKLKFAYNALAFIAFASTR